MARCFARTLSTLIAPIVLTIACFVAAGCTPATGETELAEWEAVPELHLGGEEEGPLSFSDIRSLAVDAEGRIYLLEAKEQEVRVFGPDGMLLRTIGRKGQGPGEFEQANGVALTPDGAVWVYSPATRRLLQFTGAGEFIRTHLPPANSYGWMWLGAMDSVGRLYDIQSMRIDTSRVQRLVRTDLRTASSDTLPLPECPITGPGFYSFPQGSMAIPFGSARLLQVDSRGTIWCGDTRDLRLYGYRPGETEPARRLTASLAPAPVTVAERDTALAQIERFKKQAGEADLDYSLIGATKPIVEGVSTDDIGRAWVRARTAAGFQLIVFNVEGRAVGRVPLPREPLRYGPLVVRGDRVYFVAVDADDVPSVVRYRVQP